MCRTGIVGSFCCIVQRFHVVGWAAGTGRGMEQGANNFHLVQLTPLPPRQLMLQ